MKTKSHISAPVGMLVIGALFLALAATVAEAKKYTPITFSKSSFMSRCRAAGGNPIDVGGGIVNCFLPNGSLVKCDFLLELCEVVTGRPPPGVIKHLLGEPLPGSANPDQGLNQPKDPGGSSTVGGGDGGPVVK